MFGVMILCVCVKHPPPFFDYYCLLSGPVLWAHIPTSVAVRKFEMNLPMYVILLFSLLFRIRVRLIAHASRSSPCESSSCRAHSSFNRGFTSTSVAFTASSTSFSYFLTKLLKPHIASTRSAHSRTTARAMINALSGRKRYVFGRIPVIISAHCHAMQTHAYI